MREEGRVKGARVNSEGCTDSIGIREKSLKDQERGLCEKRDVEEG